MNLVINLKLQPIDVFGNQNFMEIEPPMEDYEVFIDGKKCPPGMRDIIVMGLAYRSGIVGKTFSQVVEEYLGRSK